MYGPDLPAPATEESAFGAHTLPYAIHKKESDEVVQQRSYQMVAAKRGAFSGRAASRRRRSAFHNRRAFASSRSRPDVHVEIQQKDNDVENRAHVDSSSRG